MSKTFRDHLMLLSAAVLATMPVPGANVSIAEMVGAAPWLR